MAVSWRDEGGEEGGMLLAQPRQPSPSSFTAPRVASSAVLALTLRPLAVQRRPFG